MATFGVQEEMDTDVVEYGDMSMRDDLLIKCKDTIKGLHQDIQTYQLQNDKLMLENEELVRLTHEKDLQVKALKDQAEQSEREIDRVKLQCEELELEFEDNT